MDDIERYQHQLHAQLPAFRRKLDWTRQLIDDAMHKMGEQPQLSFSGGIDSTVLLDLLYSSGYRLPTLWGDDGCDFPETLTFLRQTEARYDFHLTRIRSMAPWRSWCEEMDRPDLADDPEAYDAWLNPRQWDDTWHTLTRDAVRHGYTGVFMGMLARESKSRRVTLRDGYRPYYQVASGQYNCSPLAAWKKEDIWAYAVSQGLAYNPVYDKLASLDIPLEHRRVAALTCYRVMQYGSHGPALRACWPDLSNRLSTLFPRIRAYS
jgi:3'-phosphoadenosine 5'-phosphosulfate sulfotransferase (PAPS reductase)/FAD synthetase